MATLPCFTRSTRARVSFLFLLVACLLTEPGCALTEIIITADPSTAELVTGQTQTITAVVTGSSNPEDKQVIWSVCDGQGQDCVDGGNSTVGTVVPTSADSDGNARAIYTAPASLPSPPACLSTSDGCAVVVRGKLARFEAACFTTITLHEPPNPVPVLDSLTPDDATEGEPAFTLGVTGSNFILSSVVRWDGSDRTTTFLSSTQLEAAITATDIAAAGTASVTVFNPSPGGGTSNALTFTIAPAVACVPGVTERASVATDGTEGIDDSGQSGAVSADGRFVAFASAASNLVSGDTNGVRDVFVRDTCRGAISCSPSTVRVSVASDGTQGNITSGDASSLSADGRFVAFTSFATNLVSGDTNATGDIFVHDRDTDNDGIFDEAGAIATVRVSVASDGTQGNASSGSPSFSADGRFVAFTSFATNLVSGDTNGSEDVFVHDRDTENDGIFDEAGAIATVRVSVASDGTEGAAPSGEGRVAISADGRFVAFHSFASNLVSGDTNATRDIFVHDRDTDTDGNFDESGAIATVRVSVASDGTQGNSESGKVAISATGRFVAFESFATNLVSGDTNATRDIFVHDRDTDNDGIFDEAGAIATVRVSVASDGTEANNFSAIPSISANGRIVAFASFATNLVSGDANARWDVFVHDRDTDNDGILDEAGAIATLRVSVASDGTEGNADSGLIDDFAESLSLSADGRFAAFISAASNLVTGDTNGQADVFVAQNCFVP